MSRVTRYTFAGFAYGALLFFFGFVCAGFGHGTYLPFVIFGSPLSFIPVVGVFAAPVFWAAWAFIAAKAWRFNLPLAILLLHAIGVLVVFWSGSYFESAEDQWNSFGTMYRRDPGFLWSALAAYVVGQAMCWRLAYLHQLSKAG